MTGHTKTTWLEHSMTTAAKKAALDNLENLYGDSVTYVGSITHSERYYTDAEAAANYFTAANDGEDSDLVADTVDGHPIADIISNGIPSGVIAIWSGSVASIPAGWYLCNGDNGTPDLREKFIVNAGGTYSLDETTTTAAQVPVASAVTIGTTALTESHLPAHTHTYTDYYFTNGQPGYYLGQAKPSSAHNTTTTTATSDAHGHTGSSFTGASTSILPASLALCFIMKA